MSDVNKTMDSSIAKAKREQGRGVGLSPAQSAEQFHAIAEQLADELYAKGKKFTVFHNELARQTAAHCPRVARMLVQVWSGMCATLEEAIERYEQQMRMAQRFHSRFVRLAAGAEAKTAKLAHENEQLKGTVRDLRGDLAGKSATIAALNREIDVWKSEVNKLNKRFADEMHARLYGDKFGHHRPTDTLSTLHDDALHSLEAERAKQLTLVEQQNRLIRTAATAMLRGSIGVPVEKSHTGTQTLDTAEGDVQPPPPPVLAERGGIFIPKEFRHALNIIPRKTKLFSLRFMRRFVLQIILEKTIADHTTVEGAASNQRMLMSQFIPLYMLKKYGLPTIADAQISSLIQTIRAFYDSDRRCRIFDLFVGAMSAREDDRAVFGMKCQDIVSEFIWKMMEKKQIQAQLVLTGTEPDATVYVNRQKAIEAMKEIFHFIAPALVDLMLVRVRTLPAARGKASHMLVSFEDILCIVFESWVSEQFRWQKRIQALFDKASEPGPALHEDKEPLSMSQLPDTSLAHNARKRQAVTGKHANTKVSPIPSSAMATSDLELLSDALAPNDLEATDNTGHTTSGPRFFENKPQHGKSEEVVRPSLDRARNNRHISLPALRTYLVSAMPHLDMHEIDFMFDQSRKMLEHAAWHKKRKVWKQAVDPATQRKYFYNTHTLETRWYMPILERQTVTSLDYNTFVEMCLRNNLLMSTASERDALDPQTKASILIQKIVRGFVSRRRRRSSPHAGGDGSGHTRHHAVSSPDSTQGYGGRGYSNRTLQTSSSGAMQSPRLLQQVAAIMQLPKPQYPSSNTGGGGHSVHPVPTHGHVRQRSGGKK